MIFTPKHTNLHFFDTSLKILTPAPLVVLVTNIRYASYVIQVICKWWLPKLAMYKD